MPCIGSLFDLHFDIEKDMSREIDIDKEILEILGIVRNIKKLAGSKATQLRNSADPPSHWLSNVDTKKK